MNDSILIEHLRKSLQTMDEMPDEMWFAEMQSRGIIDEVGRVLKRMPEVPLAETANGKKKRSRKRGSKRPPSA